LVIVTTEEPEQPTNVSVAAKMMTLEMCMTCNVA
jgi:hypothetical protein